MKLHEQKHYYGFSGLPNYWVDDKDNRYSDEFFDDKTYEDLYFDNFSDMDKMFGHENSLFGTRGLPVGHPDRTSKSFDQYNKTYGPMIVRVVNDTTLQEQTNRIKQMMGVIFGKPKETQPNISLRRRMHCFNDFVDKLENEELDSESIPPIIDMEWEYYQAILTAFMKRYCGESRYDEHNENLHQIIMEHYGERLYKWFKKNVE